MVLFSYTKNPPAPTQITSNVTACVTAKSAVGAHIMSSLDGVMTLRAFGVEQRFLHAFDVHQDRSTAACYLHLAADRWFGMRVDLIGFTLVLGTTLGAVLMVQYQG